jgi:hypothetical protein
MIFIEARHMSTGVATACLVFGTTFAMDIDQIIQNLSIRRKLPNVSRPIH